MIESGGCGWITASALPSRSRCPTSVPFGSVSIFSPGFGVNAIFSSSSSSQWMSSHGTPYSNLRSPLASSDSVVWNERMATRLPFSSAGVRIGESARTKNSPQLNSRRGKIGTPVIGSLRSIAIR